MLVARNIHKSYGSIPILNGIDLEVTKGEVVAIVGPSGAGKSTLLQIIGTLDKPDRGSLLIENQSIYQLDSGVSAAKHILSERQLALFRNEHLGFVFQFHNLLPEFTALENVCMPAWLQEKGSNAEKEARATELLHYLGLGHRLNHRPSQLSGGEQQRTAVARALMNKPSIVLADEPSGNLDSHNAEELHRLFFNLRKDFNQTFIIVTHNEKLAEAADRKINMVDGRISV
ncbi:MAG: ABC transporter ATP-binding protein [Cytophagaceae bacterium]|jgi:lipoprotein-releasing system ATP-binding protein|nr:ABC transporter ATP-binding protein [Cytophagaceae bacterium]